MYIPKTGAAAEFACSLYHVYAWRHAPKVISNRTLQDALCLLTIPQITQRAKWRRNTSNRRRNILTFFNAFSFRRRNFDAISTSNRKCPLGTQCMKPFYSIVEPNVFHCIFTVHQTYAYVTIHTKPCVKLQSIVFLVFKIFGISIVNECSKVIVPLENPVFYWILLAITECALTT